MAALLDADDDDAMLATVGDGAGGGGGGCAATVSELAIMACKVLVHISIRV